MAGTRALAWMVGVALVAMGCLGGCGGGEEGPDRAADRATSGIEARTGGEPPRVYAYLEHDGRYYDLTAGEFPAGEQETPSGRAGEPTASRSWVPYPPTIPMFQEVVVPDPADPEGITAYVDLHGDTPGLELPGPVHAATGTIPAPAPLGTAGGETLSLGYTDVFFRLPSPVTLMEPGTTILRSVGETLWGAYELVLRHHSWTEWDEETQKLVFYYTLDQDLYWNGQRVSSWSTGTIKGRRGSLNILMGMGTPVCGPFTVSKSVQTIPPGGVPGPDTEIFRKIYRQRRLVFAEPFEEIEVSEGQGVDFRNQARWLLQDYPGPPVTIPLDPGEEIHYRFQIRDQAGLVVADSGIQSGSELAWTWEGPVVAARGAAPGPYRLVPAGEDGGDGPATAREEDFEEPGDGDVTTYTYDVEMSAPFYLAQFGPYPAMSVASAGGVANLARTKLIEVLDLETGARLATSNMGFPGIRELISRVYPANLAGQNRRLKVQALVPVPADQQTLRIKVRTSQSNPEGLEVQLYRVPGTRRFEGEVTLDQQLIRPHSWSATSLDASELNDSRAFEEKMRTRLSSPLMGRVWHQHLEADEILGVPWENRQRLLSRDNVPTEPEAFQAAGYEILQVDVPGVEGPDGGGLYARMRVRNQAEVLYFSGHGLGGSNSLTIGSTTIRPGKFIGDPGEPLRPINLEPVHWQGNLRRVIIAACSVLDINDYNGWWPSSSPNGGLVWDHVLGNPGRGARLFGYNQAAPLGPVTDTNIINGFLDSVMSPLDWLEANACFTPYDSACAIDAGHYYFIQHEWRDTEQLDWTRRYTRVVHTNRWKARVARSEWSRPDPESHLVERLGEQLDDVEYWKPVGTP